MRRVCGMEILAQKIVLQAFFRYIARRKTVRLIYADNGAVPGYSEVDAAGEPRLCCDEPEHVDRAARNGCDVRAHRPGGGGKGVGEHICRGTVAGDRYFIMVLLCERRAETGGEPRG